MRICCVYCYPLGGANGYFEYAIKFLQTFHQYAAGIDHSWVVVSTETPTIDETRFLFGSLPGVIFLDSLTAGRDLAAFQLAAERVPCDAMMFFGSHAYFKRAGWLKRMVDVFNQYGCDNLYGCTGNAGDRGFNIWPHIRTTAFMASPSLMNAYPLRCQDNGLRYEMEHGEGSLTSWVIKQGKRAYVVAWDNVVTVAQADSIQDGFHHGNQANVIVGDRLTTRPYFDGE